MLRFLDLCEAFEGEAQQILPVHQTDSFRELMILLLRNHLEARQTTITNLARAASVPYATAIRRIEAMIEAGLVVRRPRTRTGKTFSLHPGRRLIEAWYDYARRLLPILARAAPPKETGPAARSFSFMGSYAAAKAIPVLSVLERPLPLIPPLRVLVHADPMFMAMDSLKRQFEQVFGVSVRIRALSIDRLRAEALAHAHDRHSPYDIIACDLPWIGEFAEKKVLKPLDDFIHRSRIDADDFHPAGWTGCKFRGLQFGIPVQTTPELLLFRKDLFAAKGLKAPETIEEVLYAARRLHAPQDGIRGIAWNAARGTPLGHTFLFAMAAFGQPVLNLGKVNGEFCVGDLDGEHRRPMIATPEGRAAAEYLRRLVDYSPVNILSMAWFERIAAYARGEVAMAFSFNMLVPYFELDANSPARGNTGFLAHPRGPKGRQIAPTGGFALGIPANIAEERLAGALQALHIVTSAEACKSYILNGSLVAPRFSVSNDPEVSCQSSVIAIVDEMARNGTQQVWPRPAAPEIADIITICGEEIHDALRDIKTIDAAIRTAQDRADQLIRTP